MQPGFPGQHSPGSGSGHAMGYPNSEQYFGMHIPSGHSTYRSLRLHLFAEKKSTNFRDVVYIKIQLSDVIKNVG